MLKKNKSTDSHITYVYINKYIFIYVHVRTCRIYIYIYTCFYMHKKRAISYKSIINRLHHNQSSENLGIMTHTNWNWWNWSLPVFSLGLDGLAESDVSISHHIIKRIKDVAMTSIPKAMPKDSESRKVPISKDSVRLGSQDTTPQNKNLSTHATRWDSYG